MRYFQISNGLRGMYMPDSAYAIACATRRELKEALEQEARDIRDAGAIGLSKRAIAALAAAQWRDKRNYLPYAAGYRWREQSPGTAPYGLFVAPLSRAEYLESQEEY